MSKFIPEICPDDLTLEISFREMRWMRKVMADALEDLRTLEGYLRADPESPNVFGVNIEVRQAMKLADTVLGQWPDYEPPQVSLVDILLRSYVVKKRSEADPVDP